jgi:uncharacterized protein (TIGR04255 family)
MKLGIYEKYIEERFPNAMLARVSLTFKLSDKNLNILFENINPYLEKHDFKELIPKSNVDEFIDIVSLVSSKKSPFFSKTFKNNKSEQIVQVRRNEIEIILRNYGYLSFSKFRKNEVSLILGFFEENQFKSLKSIRLNYLNDYKFPLVDKNELKKMYLNYFEPYFNSDQISFDEFDAHLLDFRKFHNEIIQIYKIVLDTKKSKKNGEWGYFLDFTTLYSEEIKIEDLDPILEELHTKIKEMFFQSITENFIIQFLKKPKEAKKND